MDGRSFSADRIRFPLASGPPEHFRPVGPLVRTTGDAGERDPLTADVSADMQGLLRDGPRVSDDVRVQLLNRNHVAPAH